MYQSPSKLTSDFSMFFLVSDEFQVESTFVDYETIVESLKIDNYLTNS